MTREDLVQEILKNDPNEDQDSEAFKAQLVLLASAVLGTFNQTKLRDFTKVEGSLIAKFAHNLRKSGVWKGRNTICANWCDEEEGGVAFMLDTLVATGMMQRAA